MDSFVFTRHSSDCKFKRDRFCNRCNCPKWVEGRFNHDFRKSAKTRVGARPNSSAKNLKRRSQRPAAFRHRGGDRFGANRNHPLRPISPPAPRTGVPEPRGPKPRPRVTVAKAVEAYLADALSRSVKS